MKRTNCFVSRGALVRQIQSSQPVLKGNDLPAALLQSLEPKAFTFITERKNSQRLERRSTMSERLPFNKRNMEAFSHHDYDSPSRAAKSSDFE